jgi:hypothetical protein
MEFLAIIFLTMVFGHFLLTAIGYIGILFSPDYDETESKRHSRFKK